MTEKAKKYLSEKISVMSEKNILEKIKEVVSAISPRTEVFLYGSRAKGKAASHSDWDILILLNAPELSFDAEKKFIDALYEVEIETGEVISPMIYTKSEWNSRHSVTPLFENVQREGMRIS